MKQDKRAVEITVQLLKEHNIHQIVISPGGTNIPFIKMVQDDPFFHCYSVVDERSAIYFAIGLYLRTGEIIATSCTSAQATRNYIPGLTEAYYKRVPILAITMEKLPRFIGQEYMQAPHQCSLPDDSVKKSVELPYIRDVNDEYECIRKVNDAILELTHHGNGPIQLCIPWLDFPIAEQDPVTRNIRRRQPTDVNIEELTGKKILIVVGEHRKFTPAESGAIENFSGQFHCAVYVNSLSNYHGKYSVSANLPLSGLSFDDFEKSYAPDLILSIGGQTGDYPLYGLLSKPELSRTEHWRINEDGKVIDTYDKLTDVFECSIIDFFGQFLDPESSSHSYYEAYNLRIILVNNNGGVEFKLNHANHSETDKYIAAAGHFKDAEGWARTCGFEYLKAGNKEEFDKQYEKLLQPSDKPILFELFISDQDDFEGYSTLIQANRNMEAKDYLKKGIKRLIGR